MQRGDRINITSGPYKGCTAVVSRKCAGTNDTWWCKIEGRDNPFDVPIFESEIEAGDGEVTR